MQQPFRRGNYARPFQAAARAIMRCLNYEVVGQRPPGVDKCVVIGAPHSSGWDLPYMLLTTAALGLPTAFLMKDTLFWWPLSILWRLLGGIPVNRRERTSLVGQAAAAFQHYDTLYLVIAPEGTRKEVEYWHTGFYWIACEANVPILLGFINYPDRRLGVGELLYPTGNLDEDFQRLRAFYEPRTGIVPRFRPQDAEGPQADEN